MNQENANVDIEGEEDKLNPQGIIRLVVKEYRQLTTSISSPSAYVRSLPWQIIIKPKKKKTYRAPAENRSFSIQCNGDPRFSNWSCQARIDYRIISQKEGVENINGQISHQFCPHKNNFNFDPFLKWCIILDPQNGYIKDDCIVFEVSICAEIPHGISWDSKRDTGFIGLTNQTVTCYQNSLLQTLFSTNKFRKFVLQLPVNSLNDENEDSVFLALRHIFYDLQFADKPVLTFRLTRSLEWEEKDLFIQGNVQGLHRALLDNIEIMMKRTYTFERGIVPELFQGKLNLSIRCKNVNFSFSRTESFDNIELNIKDMKDIYASFEDYVAVTNRNGKNKYDAGEHGLQEADEQITFKSFPSVLHLQLSRFQYDSVSNSYTKNNDRFIFPVKLNLEKFLVKAESTPADYTLHSVLCHTGETKSGHYVVFIDPKCNGNWRKFNDNVVSRCNDYSEAIDDNFGGYDETQSNYLTNAYMLVYIRNSALDDILQDVTRADIPDELKKRIQQEKEKQRNKEKLRRKKWNEANLFLKIRAYNDQSLENHTGLDLINQDRTPCFHFLVLKTANFSFIRNYIAKGYNKPPEHVIILQFNTLRNLTFRPMSITTNNDNDSSQFNNIFNNEDKPIMQYVENGQSMSIFFVVVLPYFYPRLQSEKFTLLFIKYFNIENNKLSYVGHFFLPKIISFTNLRRSLFSLVGLPGTTPLALYEEEYLGISTDLTSKDEPITEILSELIDGDILVFHRKDIVTSNKIKDFYAYKSMLIEIQFYNAMNPKDLGFCLELKLGMNNNEISLRVAQFLGVEPDKLLLSKKQSNTSKFSIPGKKIDALEENLLQFKPFQHKLCPEIHTVIDLKFVLNHFKVAHLKSHLTEEVLSMSQYQMSNVYLEEQFFTFFLSSNINFN